MSLLHNLAIKRRPVLDAAVHRAHMDKVEALFPKYPLAAGVVDLELEVRRHLARLCRREIRADDLGGRKLVGKVTVGLCKPLRRICDC